MLDAINQVMPAVGKTKLSQFLVIRGGKVCAFNGEKVLTANIPCTLEFAPKAKAFWRALRRCRGGIQLWVNPEGNIMIHSDNHDETVKCEPLNKFPSEIQTGFWFNEPKPRKPGKPKCVPPDPTWLQPGYLPGLEEARAFNLPLFQSRDEIVAAAMAKEPLVCDCEVYPNYFLVSFASVVSGKIVYFEMTEGGTMDLLFLRWILEHFLIVTFNGNSFDAPMLALALAGLPCSQLKTASDQIIVKQVKAWQVLRSRKVRKLNPQTFNHIDLIEVLPLDGSLKLYAGRMHAPRLQDLPFPESWHLTPDQISIVRYYCANDLCGTAFCFVNLKDQIAIRESMTTRYGQDLRSKSDAQIAEAVINGELERLTFAYPERSEVPAGTRYRYQTPAFIRYHTPMMQRFLQTVQGWEFWVNEAGYIELPVDPATGKAVNLQINIGSGVYTVGMGGLHSNEQVSAHQQSEDCFIFDRDVASYYPQIILNLELYPRHLGPAFLQVYRSIVLQRLEAKAAKNKILAEMLKIVVNGSFGKLGSKWSTLYAPDLMMTVTITGQLSLLMLIERLEMAGITVCSANTDGIVFKTSKAQIELGRTIFAQWEKETGFTTEETQYVAIYSRDVNNYIAVKTDSKTKAKGAYLNPWAMVNPGDAYERFKKNPHGVISIEAATEFLTKGTPVSQTIRNATDPRKFVAIRTVRGGAVKDGQYLGKAVRWYYKKGETGAIVYALTGKMVAETEGAWPCMQLPEKVPQDVDYEYYEAKALKILQEIGASS